MPDRQITLRSEATSSLDRVLYSSYWISLAPNTIVIAVQLWGVSWIAAANRRGARGPSFGAVSKRPRAAASPGPRGEALPRDGGGASARSSALVAMVIAGLPVVVAAFGVQTARMCECQCRNKHGN
jgi:hypothetical protein